MLWSDTMYFGSVRFFRHLLLGITGLIIFTLAALTIIFGVMLNTEKNKAIEASAKYTEIVKGDNLNIPKDFQLNDIMAVLKDKGYTTEDIIEMLAESDTKAAGEVFRRQFYNSDNANIAYTELYPNLYAVPPTEFTEKEKTIYLTFDDGPSANTLLVLSILEKYDIKATFFVSGSTTEEGKSIMRQIVEKGHTIGIHSYSHDYEEIYVSVEAFLEDLNNTYNIVYEATGVKPDVIRFAGGSINNYNRLIYKQLIAEVTRRGFVYYDWNVSGEDASPKATWTSIYNHVLDGIKDHSRAIILLHDSADKERTVLVLEDLIQELQKQGYSFDKITNDVTPTTFGYKS